MTPAFWLCVAALVVVLLNFIRFRSAPDGRLRPRETLRKILSIPVAVAMSLVAAALALFSVYMSYAAPRDFIQDIVSAKRVLRGESAYPEQMNSLIREGSEPASWSLSKYFPGLREKEERESRPVLQYQAHPPLLVLFTVPLVFVAGTHGAALLMDLISLPALAVTVILIRKGLALDFPLGAGLAVIAAILSWSPVLTLLRQSQSGLFIGLLLVLAWFLLRRKLELTAGIMVGIATCLKLYPGLLLAYLLLRHRRALAGAAAAMAVFALLPMPWMGWHAYADYARITSGVVSFYGAQNHDISLLAMFRKNGVPMSTAGLMAIGLAVVGCAAWLIGPTREPSSKACLDLEYSLFLVLTVLFSPIAWGHYLVLLLLPLFVLGERAFRSEPDWAAMFGVVCVALVFAVPIDTYVLPDTVRKISRLAHVRVSSIPTIAQIVLAVWTAWVIWKTRPAVSARSRPAQGAVPATPAY